MTLIIYLYGKHHSGAHNGTIDVTENKHTDSQIKQITIHDVQQKYDWPWLNDIITLSNLNNRNTWFHFVLVNVLNACR